MATPLYPTFQKHVRDSFDQLIKNQITPWVFLNSGKPMKVLTHDQRQISYQGIGFEGSPENEFWSLYIEPFMEEISMNEISRAIQLASDKNVDAALLLPEIKLLLLAGVNKTYSEMARIDQLLRGRGFPNKIPLRPIEDKCEKMERFIDVHIKSELEMWAPRSGLEIWFEHNKFIVWLIGIVIGIAGLYASFI